MTEVKQVDFAAMGKALNELFIEIVEKGSAGYKTEEMKKEFEEVIARVFGAHGGSDSYTNLRSPGMAEALNRVSPGKSGDYDKDGKPIGDPKGGWYESAGTYSGQSSQTFSESRGNSGDKPSFRPTPNSTVGSAQTEMGGRVQTSSIDTRHSVPSALYGEPTSVGRETGYDPRPLGKAFDRNRTEEDAAPVTGNPAVRADIPQPTVGSIQLDDEDTATKGDDEDEDRRKAGRRLDAEANRLEGLAQQAESQSLIDVSKAFKQHAMEVRQAAINVRRGIRGASDSDLPLW